jgi:hypothetical protein
MRQMQAEPMRHARSVGCRNVKMRLRLRKRQVQTKKVLTPRFLAPLVRVPDRDSAFSFFAKHIYRSSNP